MSHVAEDRLVAIGMKLHNEAEVRAHAEWLLSHPKCAQALSLAREDKLASWDFGAATLSALKKRKLVASNPPTVTKGRAYQASALGKEVWAAYCAVDVEHRP
jgi:hypothetical protein